MFIKKDLRKIPKILEDAVVCDNDDDDDENSPTISKDGPNPKRTKVEEPLSVLRLGRRHQEFQGSVRILCQPQYLPKLQQLKNLNLYDCAISDLEGIGLLAQCPKLEILNLGRNPLTTLPEDLAKLSGSLKELWLDDCQLQGPLPDCVAQLTHLESFRAPNNQITHIPEALLRLQHLKVLCLDRNPLGKISEEGDGDDDNSPQTSHLPEDWHGLRNLEELYLRHTQLTRLPRRLPSKSLKVLHLSSNPLTNVDSLLMMTSSSSSSSTTYQHRGEGLPELTQLYLNGCQLESLPTGIVSQLPKLKRLVISHNPPLKHAPMDMWHALRGKELLFGDNDDNDGAAAGGIEIVWQPNPQLIEGTTIIPENENNIALLDDDDDDDGIMSSSDDENEDEQQQQPPPPDGRLASSSAMEGVELSKE